MHSAGTTPSVSTVEASRPEMMAQAIGAAALAALGTRVAEADAGIEAADRLRRVAESLAG